MLRIFHNVSTRTVFRIEDDYVDADSLVLMRLYYNFSLTQFLSSLTLYLSIVQLIILAYVFVNIVLFLLFIVT